MAVVSFVEHQAVVLQEVLHCTLPDGSVDNTAGSKTEFDYLH
jgi:hypothetical protein